MSCLKEGKLTKRGTGYPYTWRERQFVLTPTALTYATVDGVGKGSFALNKSTVVTSLSQADMPGKKSPFGFKLSTGVDDLYIFASSDEDRAGWIDAIVAALASEEVPASTPARGVSATSRASPIKGSKNHSGGASSTQPAPGETRLEHLARRIKDQTASTSDKRLRRAADRENARLSAQQHEAALLAEETAEAAGLVKLLADLKISEDTVRLAELKKTEKKLAALTAALDSESTPADRAVCSAEQENFTAEWAKLGAKAAEFAEQRADAEHAVAVASALAVRALTLADAAEAKALRLRAESTQLVYAEAEAKLKADSAILLASAPWTNDFRAEIDEKMSKRAPLPPVPSPIPASKGTGTTGSAASGTSGPTAARGGMEKRSTSFMKIVSGSDDDAGIDVERRRRVEKKLCDEEKFKERFIWINEETGCLHWSKSDRAGQPSKSINIKACCKTVVLCRPPKGASWIGFTVEFKPDLDSKEFMNAKGASSKSRGIDVKVHGEDATQYVETVCRKIINILRPSTAKTPQ